MIDAGDRVEYSSKQLSIITKLLRVVAQKHETNANAREHSGLGIVSGGSDVENTILFGFTTQNTESRSHINARGSLRLGKKSFASVMSAALLKLDSDGENG
jgi:hypothetical protein